MKNKILLILSLITINLICSFSLWAKPLNIIAAENFYGDIAQQIGGPYVQVTSILKNPNQDPHLFSANPSTVRSISNADIVIYNGINYDPWMEKLLKAAQQSKEKVIVVADLLHKKTGDNPHLWYDPETMLTYADSLTDLLIEMDSAHKTYYEQRLTDFKRTFAPLVIRIFKLKQQLQNTNAIATEPVFNYMADTLGLKMLGKDFQLSVMNDVAPSATQIRGFENDLRSHKAKLLFYNNQVSNPVTQRMQNIAKKLDIPEVGVSETQPVGKTYVEWMLDQLKALGNALRKGREEG